MNNKAKQKAEKLTDMWIEKGIATSALYLDGRFIVTAYDVSIFGTKLASYELAQIGPHKIATMVDGQIRNEFLI
jgi:hypothetical protein